jgi:hypothetical protein
MHEPKDTTKTVNNKMQRTGNKRGAAIAKVFFSAADLGRY